MAIRTKNPTSAAIRMRPGAPVGSFRPPPLLVGGTNVPGAFSTSRASPRPGDDSVSTIGAPGATELWYM